MVALAVVTTPSEGVPIVLGCCKGVAAKVLLLAVKFELLPLTLAGPLEPLMMQLGVPKFFKLPMTPLPIRLP